MGKDQAATFVFVCTGKDCRKNGSKKLIKEIKAAYPRMRVIKAKCSDHCKKGPVVFYDDKLFLKATVKKFEADVNKKGA